MPFIPLPKQPGPLGNAPNSPLERERRPTVDTSEIQQALSHFGKAAQMPMIDEGPYVQAAGALASVGKGIVDASSVIEKAAQHEMETTAKRQIFDAEDQLFAAAAELEASRDITKPETWLEQFNTGMNTALERVLAQPGLSDFSSEQISQSGRRMISRQAGMVQVQGRRAGIKLVGDKYRAGAINAASQKDYAGGAAMLDQAAAGGYVDADEAARYKAQIPEWQKRDETNAKIEGVEGDRNGFATVLQNDPWEAKRQLETQDPERPGYSTFYPNSDPVDVQRMKEMAEGAINKKQHDALSVLQDKVVTGEASDAEIQQAQEMFFLTPTQVAKIKDLRERYAKEEASKRPLDREAVASLFDKVMSYEDDLTTDPKGEKWTGLLNEALVLTAAGGEEGDMMRGVFKQHLYARNPWNDRRTDMELPDGVEKEFMAIMGTYRNASAFGIPSYVVEKGEKPNAETGKMEAHYESVPNQAATRRFASVQANLWRKFTAAAKKEPEKFLVAGAVEKWIDEQLAQYKAATKAEAAGIGSLPLHQGSANADALPSPGDFDNRAE